MPVKESLFPLIARRCGACVRNTVFLPKPYSLEQIMDLLEGFAAEDA